MKETKLELNNLSNRELIESAFKQIEKETGFHISDKYYGDTYFLIEDEDDSICNFRIKEIPGFIFSFWNKCRISSDYLDIPKETELLFFTQFERDLDKFKPSRSGFLNGIFRQIWEEGPDSDHLKVIEEWYMNDIINILNFMRKHYFKSYYYVQCCISNIWYEVNGMEAFKEYIRDAIYYNKSKLKQNIKNNRFRNKAIRLCNKLKHLNIILTEEDNCYPRFHIISRRFEGITKEDFNKEYDKLDKFYEKHTDFHLVDYDNNIEFKTKEEEQQDKHFLERFEGTLGYHLNDEFDGKILFINLEKKYKKK